MNIVIIGVNNDITIKLGIKITLSSCKYGTSAFRDQPSTISYNWLFSRVR